LGAHLRHAVSLTASHHIALDWRELHVAIRFWDHPSGRTRRSWARAFWSSDGQHGTDQPYPGLTKGQTS
jgi:CRISPR type I-E-associated protein CasB/Cse2